MTNTTFTDDEKRLLDVLQVTKDITYVNDPSAKIREAVRMAARDRLDHLSITEPKMQADLIGNSVNVPENMARHFFSVTAEDIKGALLNKVCHRDDGDSGKLAASDVIGTIADHCRRAENKDMLRELLDSVDAGDGHTPLPESVAQYTDVAFRACVEGHYNEAQHEIATLLERPLLRGIAPDLRFPKGMVEYYRDHCQDNKWAAFDFTCEDAVGGKSLTLTPMQVQNVIMADLRMTACRVVMKEIGMEDSPILKHSGWAQSA